MRTRNQRGDVTPLRARLIVARWIVEHAEREMVDGQCLVVTGDGLSVQLDLVSHGPLSLTLYVQGHEIKVMTQSPRKERTHA